MNQQKTPTNFMKSNRIGFVALLKLCGLLKLKCLNPTCDHWVFDIPPQSRYATCEKCGDTNILDDLIENSEPIGNDDHHVCRSTQPYCCCDDSRHQHCDRGDGIFNVDRRWEP